MAESKEVINAILKEDLFTAKKLIQKSLLEKLGNALEEKLVDFAPTVFNEAKHLSPKQKKIAAAAKPHDKITGEDFAELRKKRKTNEEIEVNEDVEVDEEMETIIESFEQELAQIIEEIEQETGESLTEEEIAEVANELLDTLSEDESMEETEEEDDDEGPEEEEAPAGNRTVGGVEY